MNTANHFKLVTDKTRACVCVKWLKEGQSPTPNASGTKRNPQNEQKNEEAIVDGTQTEQIGHLKDIYQEGNQEKAGGYSSAQSTKKAAHLTETTETIYNKVVYLKHHMFIPTQGTTTKMMTREMTRIEEIKTSQEKLWP